MPFFMWGTVNLQPFGSYWGTLWSALIVLANVVMFLPFGFFVSLLWRGWRWGRALLLGLAVTGFVECWQLLVGRPLTWTTCCLTLWASWPMRPVSAAPLPVSQLRARFQVAEAA